MLVRSHAIRNGVYLFLLLAGYFLLLDALGWTHNLYLRMGNFLFFIILLNKTFKRTTRNKENYLYEFIAGFVVLMIGLILSVVGLYIYLKIYGLPLQRYSVSVLPVSNYAVYCFSVFMAGISFGVVIEFMLLQYYKKGNHKIDKKNQ